MNNSVRSFSAFLCLLFISACSYMPDWLGAEKKLNLPGERLSIIHSSHDLNIDPKLASKPLDLPKPIKNSGWYKSSGIKSSLVNNLYLSSPLEKQMTFKVKGGGDFLMGSTPIIENHQIYVLDTKGYIHAFDTLNGEKLWVNDYFNTNQKKSWLSFMDGEFMNGGISYSEGILYATAGLGNVIALNAENGDILWSIKLSSPTRTTPLRAKDALVVQTTDNRTFALNIFDGSIKWTHLGIGEDISVLATSAPIIQNNSLIVQYTSGEVYAIDVSSGRELWMGTVSSTIESYNIEGHLHNVINSPTIDGKTVVAFGNDGILGAFNLKGGKPIWKKSFGISKQLWIAGGYIYAITENDLLIAVNKTNGKIKWTQNLKNFDTTRKQTARWAAPIVANSKIMVVSSEGKLLSFDPAFGNKIDEMTISDNVFLAPVIANGAMYIMSNNGTITKYSAM